jgi:threonylcarbamoyladenosine tRNA methylthiotransferase MtaB
MIPRATVVNVGCRLNQSEGDRLRRYLAGQGYDVGTAGDKPLSLVIVNTCCVTGEAERTSLNRIHRAAALQPKPRLLVTGCMAESNAARLRAIPGVDEVLNIAGKERLMAGQTALPGRSRAFVKVQDGCDNRCSFCLVSTLRGRPRSRHPDFVVQEAAELVGNGFQEIVLVGLNLGRYGADIGTSLSELLTRLSRRDGTCRLRLGSLEPESVTIELQDTIVRLCAESRLCPHLHLPLQSGDDRLCQAMNRRHTPAQFRDLVADFTRRIPDVNIGADVMAGFPGEDQRAFDNTRTLVEECGLGYLHVFAYSPRPGTAASRMPDSAPRLVKRARVASLREIGARQSLAYRSRFVGQVRRGVLIDSDSDHGVAYSVLTDNYISVKLADSGVDAGRRRPGSLVSVRIDGVDAGRNWGALGEFD